MIESPLALVHSSIGLIFFAEAIHDPLRVRHVIIAIIAPYIQIYSTYVHTSTFPDSAEASTECDKEFGGDFDFRLQFFMSFNRSESFNRSDHTRVHTS